MRGAALGSASPLTATPAGSGKSQGHERSQPPKRDTTRTSFATLRRSNHDSDIKLPCLKQLLKRSRKPLRRPRPPREVFSADIAEGRHLPTTLPSMCRPSRPDSVKLPDHSLPRRQTRCSVIADRYFAACSNFRGLLRKSSMSWAAASSERSLANRTLAQTGTCRSLARGPRSGPCRLGCPWLAGSRPG